jgi:hypothetical protein
MRQKGHLDEHARHVRPDEDIERSLLHAEIRDVRIARTQVPDQRALDLAREPHGFVDLSHLQQVAQDVAEVRTLGLGYVVEPVLHRRQADGGPIVRVVQIIRLDAGRARVAARVRVDRDEEVRALPVRALGAITELERGIVVAREDRLGAEPLAQVAGEPLRHRQRDDLLDDESMRAGIAAPVAGIDHDARARVVPPWADRRDPARARWRPGGLRRGRHLDVNERPGLADAIRRPGGDLHDEPRRAVLTRADAQPRHGPGARHRARDRAPDARPRR